MSLHVEHEFPGGPGFKVRRIGPFWRWVAWPNENVASFDYYVAKGWSLHRTNAIAAGRSAAGFRS